MIGLAPSTTPSSVQGGYAPATTLCTIADPRITEASGLVASDLQDGVLFVHNDSGDSARFFALGPDCRTRATYRLAGVKARDWEDIARGPGHVLWLGDIGDNRSVRTSVVVHRVAEPRVPTSAGTVTVRATSFRLAYPDGPHDAETLLADPRDGRLYLLTKTFAGTGRLYAAPLPLRADAVNALTALHAVTFPFGSIAPTGGDISPDGRKLVLRTYGDAFETALPDAPGIRLASALAQGPGTRVLLPDERQGEAIAYSRDGRSLLTTSEGAAEPVHVLRPAAPTPLPRAATVVKQRPTDPPYAWLLLLVPGLALAAVLLRRFSRGSPRSMHHG